MKEDTMDDNAVAQPNADDFARRNRARAFTAFRAGQRALEDGDTKEALLMANTVVDALTSLARYESGHDD